MNGVKDSNKNHFESESSLYLGSTNTPKKSLKVNQESNGINSLLNSSFNF